MTDDNWVKMDMLYKQDCALCLRSFECCKPEPSEIELVFKWEEVCSAYFKTDISNSTNWDYLWTRDNPLCLICKERANHLWSLDDSLNKIKHDLSKFLKLFRDDICKSREEKAKVNEREQTKLYEEEEISEDEGHNDWPGDWCPEDLIEEAIISSPNPNFLLAVGEHDVENPKIKEEQYSHSEDNSPADDLLTQKPLKTLKISLKRLSKEKLLPESSTKRSCRPRRKVAANYETHRYDEDISPSGEEDCKSDESVHIEDLGPSRRKKKRGQKKSTTATKVDTRKTFCKICNLQFSTWRGYQNHKNTHRGLTWHCELCDETFFSVLITRQRHMKVLHPEQEKIDGVKECEVCQESFEGSVLSYEIHCLEHKKEIPYECQICHAKFSVGQNYADHFKFTPCGKSGLEGYEGGDMALNCDQCEKVFNARYLLLLHRLIHTNFDRRPISCEICGKIFQLAGNGMFLLEKHFIAHTKETPFPCDICGRRYGYVYSLEQHRFTHKGIQNQTKCDICGSKFANPDGLCRHKKNNQCSNRNKLSSKNKMKNESDTKPDSFLCDQCGKECLTKQGLKRHKGVGEYCKSTEVILESNAACTESDQVNEMKLEDDTATNSEKKMHCQVCGLDFVRQNNYKKHMKFHTEENPVQCINKDCNQKFRVFCDLKEHYEENPICKEMRDAKFEKYKYTCPICGKRIRSKAHFQLHEMTHTGEKPFKCDQCGMSFNRKDRLRLHVQKHDESYLEYPLTCRSCGFKCKVRKEVLAHYRVSPSCHSKLQQTKKHECDHCRKRFFTKNLLLDHCNEKHKAGPTVKPFQCSLCIKGFSLQKKLTRHLQTHSKNPTNAKSAPESSVK